ncbi:MAG: ABC transporter permease [Anaerolineae bacterium]|nr:ABC transporter permease [Anaerolineae bacterium]
MYQFFMRRILWMGLVLVLVSIITFLLMHQVPGGPFDREKALPERVQRNLEKKYHLDDPLLKQYADYMYSAFAPRITTGEWKPIPENDFLINIGLPFGDNTTIRWMNFGPSIKSASRTVNDIFREQFPVSAELGVAALSIACLIGMPLGTLAAMKKNTMFDYLGMGIAVLGVSLPIVTLGPLLRYIIGVELELLPPTGWGTWEQMIMPSFTLGFASSALIARLTRASLLQVLDEDYIRTARAKGLREQVVITRHAMKNAMIPIVTVLGPLFAALITGTFVTEIVFGIPGMGKYFVTSIGNRDYPVIMGTILIYAFFLVFANFIVDVIYAWLDPRIRLS